MGGCFEDGAPLQYKKAEPHTTYHFENVVIEARQANDEEMEAKDLKTPALQNSSAVARILRFMSGLCLLVAVIAAGMIAWKLFEQTQKNKA